MIHDPELIYYACIAKGTMVLAEFNSKDAALGAIAIKCLEKTPPFHVTFTHTVRAKTYTFLIGENFVYFMISDERLEKSEGMGFLKRLRDAFGEVSKGEKKLESLSSHSYQGEFNPVFHQLLGTGLDHTEGFWSPVEQRTGQSGILRRGGPFNSGKGWRRMNMFFGELNIGRRNVEESDHNGDKIGLSREFALMHKNDELYSGELIGQRNAKKAWKKQVWLVLFLDLIVCAILFVVWLRVCGGFKCIGS